MKNPFTRIIKALRHWRRLRTMPLRLEFVVTDSCNLNCRGCTHYSPLAPREFEPLDNLRHNMEHLSGVAAKSSPDIYLIGGETLLYPDLDEAMEMARRYFPSSAIYVFTNGIAIPRMPETFWQTAARCNIIMAITRYPIKFDYDSAIALCHSHGVATDIFGDRSMADSFFRFALDPDKKQNPRISHFKCYNRGCLSIVGNRLYPCSISACVGHLNKAHGTKFAHRRGDWLDIDDIKSVSQIKALRDRPVPFCGYCILPPQSVKYGPSSRKMDEWVETH